MNQLYEDLWQTRLETPFAGVQTHAYLLLSSKCNVLLYNTGHADEIQHIAKLGGITYQCLSHRDETGKSLQSIKGKFGSRLCCHVNEEPFVAQSCPVDITFVERVTRFLDLDILHTPGHTDGSITFVYRSPHGNNYLFTGDTLFQANGRWGTFVIPQAGGSTESLVESLQLYRDLDPDVVISSASNMGSASFVELSTEAWIDDINSVNGDFNT